MSDNKSALKNNDKSVMSLSQKQLSLGKTAITMSDCEIQFLITRTRNR